MVNVYVRISGVSAHLPPDVLTDDDVERRIAAASPGYRPRPGAIAKLTGITGRHRARDAEKPSDLAVAAVGKLLADRGIEARDLDLIVFAAASQDVLEPATAHVVAAKLGATCPVFDVKNACNSFLNGMQVAESLMLAGQYRRVLVVSGETGSRAVRWSVAGRAEFVDAMPGYTLSDAGGAMLLERSDSPGIRYRSFSADSSAWHISTVPGSGTANLRDHHRDGYIQGDGHDLKNAILGSDIRAQLDAALDATGLTRADLAVVCAHQVAVPYLRVLREIIDVPAAKMVPTVADHGNVASCSIPLQLSLALKSGRCGPGDQVALLRLAGGVSIGIMIVELTS